MITAKQLNDYRVVPRLLVLLYGVYAFQVGNWFMELTDPNTQQATFVSVIWGAAAVWFNFYVNSGRLHDNAD